MEFTTVRCVLGRTLLYSPGHTIYFIIFDRFTTKKKKAVYPLAYTLERCVTHIGEAGSTTRIA